MGNPKGPALWSKFVRDGSLATTGWVRKQGDLLMKNALDTIKSWAWGFIDLMLVFIAVGVLAQVIFGGDTGWFDGIVTRLMGLVSEFSTNGFVGLVALVIVLSLFNRRTA